MLGPKGSSVFNLESKQISYWTPHSIVHNSKTALEWINGEQQQQAMSTTPDPGLGDQAGICVLRAWALFPES